MKTAFFLLALSSLFTGTSRAEMTAGGAFVDSALKHSLGDVESTVYDRNTSGVNWAALSIIGATAATTYSLYHFIDAKFENPTEPARFGTTSRQLSYAGVYLPIIAPIGFFGIGLLRERGSPERTAIWETAEELAEALVLQSILELGLKLTVRRTGGLPGVKNSFPSGHASASFATAGILALRYPWYVGAPALALASALSLARLDVHAHYPSDLAAGAGIGLLFAVAVHGYHSWLKDSSKEASVVRPLATGGTFGLEWQSKF